MLKRFLDSRMIRTNLGKTGVQTAHPELVTRELTLMLTAALYFLGMAGLLVAASVCFSIGRVLKVHSSLAKGDEDPAWYGARNVGRNEGDLHRVVRTVPREGSQEPENGSFVGAYTSIMCWTMSCRSLP